ncbi:MAG: starch-binding protein [Ruminococcus sp.]|nr:starch-binding protein [Ruminococcus sp.]
MKIRELNIKQIVTAVTALLLVFVMGLSFTYSWIEGGNKGYLNGNTIQISAGSSLSMIQAGKNTSSIVIPTCNLQEVSSADGKNFFFPMADNTSNNTTQMTFREGIPADVNTKYISLDFDLVANDSAADVYLGSGTIIQCNFDTDGMSKEQIETTKKENKKLLDALRMSFFSNDGTELMVFKPTQMPGIDMDYAPITSITEVGVPSTTETHTDAYGDYYFKGEGSSTPLFELKKGETKKITLAIWLEGTEFSGNTIADTDLSIYIDFTTTVDDLIKYNFVDNCHSRGDAEKNNWVHNNIEDDGVEYETMVYIYDNTAYRYYALEKTSDTTWVGYIPKSVSNFYFRRYSIDIDEWWNEWEPSMVDIPTLSNTYNGVTIPERTFVAIAGQSESVGTNLDGCYGYWKDAEGTFRIYFEMQTPYSNLHCYAWDTSDKPCASTGQWPGKGMTFVKNTTNGVLYCIDLKESENIAGIQFNNGGETRVYLEKFDYGVNTSAYVHFNDSENGAKKEPLGAWPGTTADYDASNTVGAYWVDFTNSASNHGNTFYIIANNRNGIQYPDSGGAEGKIGRVYRFNNNSTTLERLAGPYEITGDDLNNKIFNGAAFWLKSNNEHGFYVYTEKEKSLIYPVNDPTP